MRLERNEYRVEFACPVEGYEDCVVTVATDRYGDILFKAYYDVVEEYPTPIATAKTLAVLVDKIKKQAKAKINKIRVLTLEGEESSLWGDALRVVTGTVTSMSGKECVWVSWDKGGGKLDSRNITRLEYIYPDTPENRQRLHDYIDFINRNKEEKNEYMKAFNQEMKTVTHADLGVSTEVEDDG